MLSIASLNSGSNGNCYYIGNGSEAVLVDAGISCRETERRMARLGLSLQSVKAIFISHEHSDHIRGLEVLSRKHHLPVYITPKTLHYSGLKLNPDLVRAFNPYEPVAVGNLLVQPFPKWHDAFDPHSFVVSGNGVSVAILTDIGAVCEHVTVHFKQCHAAFLETNYDEAMLDGGRYPYFLKERIRGKGGHLSNAQALELFVRHKPAFMTHVLLSHLSADNNDAQHVYNLFSAHAGHTEVVVAPRTQETAVYRIYAQEYVPMGQQSLF